MMNQTYLEEAETGRLDPRPANGMAMSYRQWIDAATECLQLQWPGADARRLRAIADELFADPRSGMLDPRQAVQAWLRMLGGRP